MVIKVISTSIRELLVEDSWYIENVKAPNFTELLLRQLQLDVSGHDVLLINKTSNLGAFVINGNLVPQYAFPFNTHVEDGEVLVTAPATLIFSMVKNKQKGAAEHSYLEMKERMKDLISKNPDAKQFFNSKSSTGNWTNISKDALIAALEEWYKKTNVSVKPNIEKTIVRTEKEPLNTEQVIEKITRFFKKVF